jgi:hypothetical protein
MMWFHSPHSFYVTRQAFGGETGPHQRLFGGPRRRRRGRWQRLTGWRRRLRRPTGRDAGNLRRSVLQAVRAEVSHDALVVRNLDLVFLLDQLLHAFGVSATGQRWTLVAVMMASRHQRTDFLLLDAPASLCLLLHPAHHLAGLLQTGHVPPALIAPLLTAGGTTGIASGCRAVPKPQKAQQQQGSSRCPHDKVSYIFGMRRYGPARHGLVDSLAAKDGPSMMSEIYRHPHFKNVQVAAGYTGVGGDVIRIH